MSPRHFTCKEISAISCRWLPIGVVTAAMGGLFFNAII